MDDLEAASTPAPAPRPRSPLRYREYRSLWGANAASNLGSQVQVVGAGWLMATLTTAPQVVALVQTAISLPVVLFILLGGALADNYDRRKIMLVSQTAMLLAAGLLAVLAWAHIVTPWSLLALVFTVSAFDAINNASWQASTRDLLPRDMISRAVALNATSINLARTAGPAIGGVIVNVAGVASAFVVNAASFLGFIIALLRWTPAPSPRAEPPERLLRAMATGLGYAARAPHVRNAVVRGGMSGLSATTVFALLPVVARQQMDGDALTYGFLLAAFGGGAVFCALSGGWLRSFFAPDTVVSLATGLMATGLLLIGLAPFSGAIPLGAAMSGGGWTLAHSTYNTAVQLSAARWVTARSLATYQTATFAGLASGSVLFGWVAQHQGVNVAFIAAGMAQAAAGLIGLLMPLPRFDALSVDPLDRRMAPPLPAFDIDPHSGPVRVELEYRVAPEDAAAFRAAMRKRAAIRRRDGARGWSLWRDAEDAWVWIESYDTPDWAEYLRHTNRRTESDRANRDALDALTEGGAGPLVRRLITGQ